MQMIAVVSGLVELALSFALALAVAWVSFRVFARMTRDIDEMAALRSNNAAAGILFASMLLAVALVVREALYPTISSLRTALFHGVTWLGAAKVLGLALLFTVLAGAGAVCAVSLATVAFMRLTRDIDELEAIRGNNLAVAVALGAVIVTMGLFLSQGMQTLLGALIPYPAIESIRILGK